MMNKLIFRSGILLLVIACAIIGHGAAEDGIGGEVGYFQITSDPTGASVYFDGTYQGTSPVTVQVYTTASPQHTISVSKEGYQTWVSDYTGNPGAAQTITIRATLSPIPTTQPTEPGSGKGYYSISSSPQGADVYFDGSYKGKTPVTVAVSTTGTPGHTVVLSMSGYQTWTNTYPGNPTEGQTVYITAYLTPVENYGSVMVQSYPSVATAVLDGVSSQTTPCTFHNVAPGSHILKVTKDGYGDYTTTVMVSAGKTTQVTAYLTKIGPTTGELYVTSIPPGANVYIGGSYYGITPQIVNDLQPGYYSLRLEKAGFQDWSDNVYVTAGETTDVSHTFSVTPTQTATQVPATGTVAVSSEPAGAQVFIDGRFEGITPVTIPSVETGQHTVLLKLDGYADWQVKVQVEAGQQENVDATLSLLPPTPTKAGLAPLLVIISLAGVVLACAVKRN